MLVKRIAELFLIAALIALVAGLANPVEDRTDDPQFTITLEALQALDPATVLIADARAPEVYLQGHIPNAVPLSEDDWDANLGSFFTVWSPEMTVVVYCDNQDCQASEHVAARLREELAIENVKVLKGGWQAWTEAELPIEPREQ